MSERDTNEFIPILVIVIGILLFIILILLVLIYTSQPSLVTIIQALGIGIGVGSTTTCEQLKAVTYQYPLVVPRINGLYEQTVARPLLELALLSNIGNCPNISSIFDTAIPLLTGSVITGYIVVYGNMAVFVFTGTTTAAQLELDLDYTLMPATELNGYINGVECHSGFYKNYLTIRGTLWQWYNSNKPEYLYITGHSLGGAISTICAYDFATTNSTIVHYSFAAPRSGNTTYADSFNSRLPTSLRVNNTEDIVPQLPPATFQGNNYKHTNNSIPFTVSLGSLDLDHTLAYIDYLPICFNNHAPCCNTTS